MSSESNDIEDDSPVYRAQPEPKDIPGFLERALQYLSAEAPEGEFTFEGVDFDTAQNIWLAPIGVYMAEEDTPSTPEEIAAGASPTGSHGRGMVEWAEGVRRAMRDAWGEPTLHTPRLVGSEQEPEGILDYMLVAQDFAEAELWERGDHFVAMLTDWSGEPGASTLRQVLLVLPREYVMNSLGIFLSDDDTAHELLMHGEQLLEVRRRAWIMSTAYGIGEVRLREAPIDACRYSLQARDGTTTVWIFADDGRALLLMHEPASEFAAEGVRQFVEDAGVDAASATADAEAGAERLSEERLSEGRLLLAHRVLDGLPAELRACITARGETVRGEVAEHALEFGLLGDEAIPVISAAFWCDGETWHTTRGLMEIAKQNGFGMDDFGFASAVRRPYRFGAPFTVELFAPAENAEARERWEQVFAACPYPEQERPDGLARLGYAIPSSSDRAGIVDELERASAAWWNAGPDEAVLGDRTFFVGGRELRQDDDGSTLTLTLAQADEWVSDALREWTEGLTAVMNERWGDAQQMQVRNPRTGIERRTPLTRVMRGTGLTQGPLWWVNGHAVLLLAGKPNPDYSTEPVVLIVLCRADAVLELAGRMSIWEMRLRARVLRNLAAIAAVPEGESPAATEQPIAWDGPPLEGSATAGSAAEGSPIVPLATRGGLRAGKFFWVWHFTHDGRGLLTSHEIGGEPGAFAEREALYAGLPSDLLTLVADRDPEGLYPVVRRSDERHGGERCDDEPRGADRTEADADPSAPGAERLAQARALPDAVAVFYYDGLDWRAPAGMLRRARAEAGALPSEEGPSTADVLATLYSAELGVAQLDWALRADDSFSLETLAGPEYSRFAFSRQVSQDEVRAAFAGLGSALEAALTGSLNDYLDVVVDGPGYRGVLDAALSNPDPQRRRELSLWLLGEGVDASKQLSLMTPIGVLFENRALDAGDAVLVRRLLERGAAPDRGSLGALGWRHPVVQLCDRDADESELLPLLAELLERVDVTAPALPDGRSLLEYARAAPTARSRASFVQALESRL